MSKCYEYIDIKTLYPEKMSKCYWKSPLELTREDIESEFRDLDLEDDDGLDVLYDWVDVFYEDVLAVAEYELWLIAEKFQK